MGFNDAPGSNRNRGTGNPIPEFEKTTVGKKERKLTVEQVYKDRKVNGLTKDALQQISDLAEGQTNFDLEDVKTFYPGWTTVNFQELHARLKEGIRKGEIKFREPRI